MRRALAFALLMAACGTGTPPAEQVEPVGGRGGESCVRSACEQGLVCKTGRGSTLCYPQTWFTGEKGAFCFTSADCNAGNTCDEQAANPFTNGVCAVKTGN